ncbi:hypothetical protein D3C84_853400 [compost metagenome]
MSEYNLTTGQMIDCLSVGEVAETDDKTMRVMKSRSGHIEDLADGKFVFLNNAIIKSKWRILPKYVSFYEAMSAHECGKNVTYHEENGDYYKFEYNDKQSFYYMSNYDVTLLKLIEGKWTIDN